MHEIAILDDYQNAALKSADWDLLPNVKITVFNNFIKPENLPKVLNQFSIVVLMRERTRFPKTLIQRLPNLLLIVTAGMRNLSIDLLEAKKCGIEVCGTDMLGYPAFEHTWGLILACMKKIPEENLVMKKGGWQVAFGSGLKGKTLGILGLGKLGSKVAKVGIAFDMDVICWSENLSKEKAEKFGAKLVSRDELFRQSDILTIHLVLSDRTKGIVDEAAFEVMKSTSYLINTSRGPIVNEDALISALETKSIAGAGLDVYDIEPLPMSHRLRQLENVVLTGHTGFVVKELHSLVYGQAVENIVAWLQGAPIRQLYDTKDLYIE